MPTLVRNSFTGGILSPELRLRSDISKYPNGLVDCRNFVIEVTGGASFRPGTQFCASLDYGTSEDCRLIPFVYSENLAYVIFLRDKAFDVYHVGERVAQNQTSPFKASEVWDLDYAQTGSEMTLVHPNHDPYILKLLDAGSQDWDLSKADVTPTIAPPTGLTLAAEGDPTSGGDFDKTYGYVVTAVSTDGRESFASDPADITQKSLSLTYGVKLDWTAPTGDVDYYRVYKQANYSTDVYGWIGDSETTTFTDFNVAPVMSEGPPSESVLLQKPSSVSFYQQRQVFGAPEGKPQSIVASQTGYPWGFQQGRPVKDADAFNMAVFTPQFNRVQYLVPLETLLILTTGSELRTTEGIEQVFGPTTTGVRQMSTNGCSKVKPTIAVDSLLYVQEKGQRLRELSYSAESNSSRLGGKDLSVLARNLFQDRRIVQIAYRNAPQSLLWCVMDDGALLGLSYHRPEKVAAWQVHDLGRPQGGSVRVKSAAVVPEGPEDMAYFVVQRDGPGGYKQASVERMPFVDTTDTENDPDKQVSVCYGMDAWLRYAGSPVSTVSGLDHLAEQEVTVVADGFSVPGVTVAEDGSITLPYEASEIRVGLGYTGRLDMLPVYGEGVVLGEPKSIPQITAFVTGSRGLWAGALSSYYDPDPEMFEIRPRQVSDGYGPPKPFTGQLDLAVLGPWNPDASLRLEQRDPFPLHLLAVEYHIDL